MFHPDTQFLIDHWRRLAHRRTVRAGVPDRAALRPDDLGPRLPRAFMIGLDEDGMTVRLAGGWIEAFHDRPLRGQPFASLWRSGSEGLASGAVFQSIREARPVVLIAAAGARPTGIELVFTPLRGASGAIDRVLGLYAPSATLTLAKDESRLLTARLSLGVGEPGRPALSLAAVHGRRVA